jgi:Zn-dependent protease
VGFAMQLLSIPPILFALSFHEFSHAWAANRLGDDTAARGGRLTLNPLRHLDPVGTILLFMAGFGWARPVPVDPRRLARPRQDMLRIAAAGPLSNLVLAVVSGLALNLLRLPAVASHSMAEELGLMLLFSVQINLVLAVFNLLPVAPLDGAAVLRGLLPLRPALAVTRFERLGPVVLLVLVGSRFVGVDLLGYVLHRPVDALSSLVTFGMVG